MRARGDVALSWAAHDLLYGIPATIDADLASGKQVVINVSRDVIDAARAKYPGQRGVLRRGRREKTSRRGRARGRESREEIEEGRARAAAFRRAGPDVVVPTNERGSDKG